MTDKHIGLLFMAAGLLPIVIALIVSTLSFIKDGEAYLEKQGLGEPKKKRGSK